MSGFKLLAIRPLEGCDKKFRKNLKEGVVYNFYQDYNFLDKDDKEINIHNDNLNEPIARIKPICEAIDLYSQDKLKINISAVVGKNGSGKSTLLELFYLFVFKISEKDILKMDYKKDIEKLNREENNEKYAKIVEQLKKLGNYSCEILYKYETTYYSTKIEKDEITHKNFENTEENTFDFSKFFYSIAINYSLYGLNDGFNRWLTALFHKNDGYKTPLVINPMRTDGNIDINRELHLGQSRTIMNLTNTESDTPEIVNNKNIGKVKFTMDVFDNNHIRNSRYIDFSVSATFENHEEKHGENIFNLFNLMSKAIGNFELSTDEIDDVKREYHQEGPDQYQYPIKDSERPTIKKIKYELVKYAIRKIFKICTQYPEYRIFLTPIGKNPEDVKKTAEISDIKGLIDKLLADKSHITLKLRQVIHTIKAGYFENDNWKIVAYYNDNNKYSYEVEYLWKDLRRSIKDYDNDGIDDKLEIIPSAFVKPEFIMVDDYGVDSLSSGEQQLSNVIQTISYHLYNLESVHNSEDSERKQYHHINIILDEIELYFHPDFQRLFIKELLKSIKSLNLDEKKIEALNIIFATHSPFILSDIPASNVLRLKDGIPEPFHIGERETFGSNVYDLLANQFFLQDGFIGAFAMETIKRILDYVDEQSQDEYNEIRHKEFLDLSNLIGDDVIRIKLVQLLDEIQPKKLDKDKRIEELKNRKLEIEREIEKLESHD